MQSRMPNKFELFERFLSFLDNGELNSVLCGYWCNVFRVLVGSNPKEVFQYIYHHQAVIGQLVQHLYQPLICEVVDRLLNFNRAVFADDPTSISEDDLE